jgi:hypothetical protein
VAVNLAVRLVSILRLPHCMCQSIVLDYFVRAGRIIFE